MKTYLILFLAIVFETVATSFLKQSEQFTKLVPSVLTVLGVRGGFLLLECRTEEHSGRHSLRHLVGSGYHSYRAYRLFRFQTAPRPGCHHRAGPDYCRSGRHQCLPTRSLIDGSVPSLCSIPNEKKEIMFFISMVSFLFQHYRKGVKYIHST